MTEPLSQTVLQGVSASGEGSLRALAEAATPGPWHSPGLGEVHDDANNCVIVDVCWRDTGADGKPEALEFSAGNGTQADADFIAAANPARVLLMLDAIDKAQEVVRAGYSDVEGAIDELAIALAALSASAHRSGKEQP